VCSHEETKGRCEASALVHTQKRGGGVSQQDMHHSSDSPQKLLQLVEPLPPIRTRRIDTEVQEAANDPSNSNPNSQRDQNAEAEDRLVSA